MERLKKAVVDSSVILKWFRPDEPHAAQALAIRQAYLDERLEIVIPELAVCEVANVLRYRASEATAVQSVETLFDFRIPICRLEHHTLQQAMKAAFRYNITVYDAIFLAVAEELHLQIVTADRPFYSAIESVPRVFFLSDLKV